MKLKTLIFSLIAALLLSACPAITVHAAEGEESTVESVEENTTEEGETDATDATEESADETADETGAAEEEESEDEQKENNNNISGQDKKETKSSKTTTTTKTKTTTTTNKVSYTQGQLRLLACLIYCEASNQPYAGKLAVGIVVQNRVRSSKFPDTLKGVIYQKSQFGPARNGSLEKALAKYDSGKFTSDAEKSCIKAAKEALSGVRKVTYKGTKYDMSSYLFFSGRVSNYRLQIGAHQFK